MFTVSHHKDGTEQFHAALSVVYHGPFSPRPHDSGDYFLEVVQDNSTFDVIGGQAYVMNETGATVAKYDLDGNNAKKPKPRL